MLHSFAHFAWQFVTRFGEGLFLLPAAVGLALWVAAQVNGVRIAGWWLIAVGLAASVTAVSKIASWAGASAAPPGISPACRATPWFSTAI